MASADSMNDIDQCVHNGPVKSGDQFRDLPEHSRRCNAQGSAPWLRGIGGGLSIASGVFSNADHIHIASNIPQHGTSANPNGYDNAGTISGFIFTDKPVMTMSPQTIPVAGPGDTIRPEPLCHRCAAALLPVAREWAEHSRRDQSVLHDSQRQSGAAAEVTTWW